MFKQLMDKLLACWEKCVCQMISLYLDFHLHVLTFIHVYCITCNCD